MYINNKWNSKVLYTYTHTYMCIYIQGKGDYCLGTPTFPRCQEGAIISEHEVHSVLGEFQHS